MAMNIIKCISISATESIKITVSEVEKPEQDTENGCNSNIIVNDNLLIALMIFAFILVIKKIKVKG